MRILCSVLAFICSTSSVVAHEMTPTYPKLKPSYVDGLLVASLTMFNARKDVDYFEVGVFDIDWNPIPFATSAKIMKVPQGNRQSFDVYIRKKDEARAVYVCTTSKLRADDASNTVVSSKVCSRVDGALP